MSPIQGLKEVQSDSHSPRGLLEKKINISVQQGKAEEQKFFFVSEVYRSTVFSVKIIQRLTERDMHSQSSTNNDSQIKPFTNISVCKMIPCQQFSEEYRCSLV